MDLTVSAGTGENQKVKSGKNRCMPVIETSIEAAVDAAIAEIEQEKKAAAEAQAALAERTRRHIRKIELRIASRPEYSFQDRPRTFRFLSEKTAKK